jgi:hypothetical protein
MLEKIIDAYQRFRKHFSTFEEIAIRLFEM